MILTENQFLVHFDNAVKCASLIFRECFIECRFGSHILSFIRVPPVQNIRFPCVLWPDNNRKLEWSGNSQWISRNLSLLFVMSGFVYCPSCSSSLASLGIGLWPPLKDKGEVDFYRLPTTLYNQTTAIGQ